MVLGDRTNQAIVATVALAAAVLVARRLGQGDPLPEATLGGAVAGVAIFLTWALGRELDPDHPLSAFVGPGLVLAYAAANGSAGALFAFWALLALRIINRTPGPRATWLDTALAGGLALWLVHQSYWVVGVAMAAAFAANALIGPADRKQWIAAGAMLIGTAIFTGIPDIQAGAGVDPQIWAAMVAVAFLMGVVVYGSREVRAVGDITQRPLSPARVQAAQAFAVLGAFSMAFSHGLDGLTLAVPLWAAMLGVGVYRLAAWPFVAGLRQ